MKEIWYKTVRDLEKKVKTDYDTLTKKVDKYLEQSGNEPKLTFSIFDTIRFGKSGKGKDWIIVCPDLDSADSVFDGQCVFYRENNEYKGNPIYNPTWRQILIEANNAVDEDHRFLESLRVTKKDKRHTLVEMIFGS